MCCLAALNFALLGLMDVLVYKYAPTPLSLLFWLVSSMCLCCALIVLKQFMLLYAAGH